MSCPRPYCIILALLFIILVQFKISSCERSWPRGYDVFDISNVQTNNLARSNNEVPTKLSNFEKLLTNLKDNISVKKLPGFTKIQNLLNQQEEIPAVRVKHSVLDSVTKKMTNAKDSISSKVNDVTVIIGESPQKIIDGIEKSVNHVSESLKKVGKTFGDFLNSMKPEIQAIFPGTRWCGDGNNAKDEDDLGLFKGLDACCREHDHCPFNIPANESYAHLKNIGLFTRSACFCDRAFYNCLKNDSNIVAKKIGFTYFTILGPQCIGYDHPIVSCAKSEGLLDDKCIDYNVDDAEAKTLQWYNSPDF